MKKENALTPIIVSVLFIAVFLPARAYSQEVVAPVDVVKKDVAVMEEAPVVYVKPGNVTVNFKDADIRAVLNYLSEVSGVDIVASPDIQGSVTLNLTDKPWERALDIVIKDYAYKMEDDKRIRATYVREGDIIRVLALSDMELEELQTEMIPLGYATVEEMVAVIYTPEIIEKYIGREEGRKQISLLSSRGILSCDQRTNTLIIKETPANLSRLKRIIRELDKKTPQIMIEAKIIETVLDDEERLGINWNLVIAASGAKRPTTLPFEAWATGWLGDAMRAYLPTGQTTQTTGTGGVGTVAQTTPADFPTGRGFDQPFPVVPTDQFTFGTLDFSQFSAVLEYLKERSDTDIISSPRITTLNNKEATIFVGKVYNFPIFDQAELTGKWVISGYEGKKIGIQLVVTPHINEEGNVVVRLAPEIGNYLGLQTISAELKAPMWSERKAETEVMVPDGETIFIGGLIRENVREYDKKFPLLGDLLGDVPFIGPVFKYKSETKEKVELVFFITVHVVKDLKALTKYATRDISELVIDLQEAEETAEEAREEVAPLEAFNAEDLEEGHKPLFDFRKHKE
ncbi:MAG: secretin N-terminal domain-containing protein [Candidatus Omnitrophota bacterium]